MNIYVASSWRNDSQPGIVRVLREHYHAVYDFRNPVKGDSGFHWSEIDPHWEDWDTRQYIKGLTHPLAEDGFDKDFAAMKWADACVLVMPCGRSAHLEAGWFTGAKKPLLILVNKCEPELMYKISDGVYDTIGPLVGRLRDIEEELKGPVTMSPLPDYGDHMTVEKFVRLCKSHALIDYDGTGYYATETAESSKHVWPSQITDGIVDQTYTHVMWFNR